MSTRHYSLQNVEIRWPILGCVVLLLAACATGAPPRPAAVSLPSAYGNESSSATLGTLDHWWTLYDDPQLTTLVQQALSQGFSVREALARLDESRALRSVALAAFGLQGNLQANAEYQNTHDLSGSGAPAGFVSGTSLGASKTASVSLPVSWELDFFGRRSATQQSTAADLDSARFNVESARAAIAAEVARSLFQTRGFKAQRDEAIETVRIQHDLFKAVTERVARGLAASSEADRVAADLAQAEAQADDLGAAFTASRRALLAVVGSGTDVLGKDDMSGVLGSVPMVPAAIPSDLLARRPDVRMAAAAVRKAASKVRLAELDFFPRFTLNPGIGLSAQRGLIDSTTSFWSLAMGLTVPILDRPRLQAQLNAEGARAEQAVLAYERIVQTAFSEADQSLIRLQADRRRVVTLTAGEKRARSSYDAAHKRYQLGFADLQELLDAERAWRGTRSALTSARLDALQRSVQVFQALGGGWNAAAYPTNKKG